MSFRLGILPLIWTATALAASGGRRPKCERIEDEKCRDLPYNVTSYPNLLGDQDQKTASDNINSFEALIKIKCSEHLKFYLCSLNFPMCNEKVPVAIGPCRPLCESVKAKCLPYLMQFGLSWPANMNCSRLPPENNNDHMCMPGPEVETTNTDADEEEKKPEAATSTEEPTSPALFLLPPSTRCRGSEFFYNRTNACIPLCNEQTPTQQADRQTSSTFLLVLCCCSVLFTASSIIFFFARPHVLPTFPERSLLWSAISFMASSIVYLFSLQFREEVSCTMYAGISLTVVPSLPHIPCTTLAAVLFYLGTAGRLWWFVMCLAWKEHTVGNYVNVNDKYRRQVCLLAWTAPLAVVMLALMARSIQTDSVLGICLVGAASKILEGIFLVGREGVMLLVVIVPLFGACCAMNNAAATSQPNTEMQPMSSMLGKFSVVYPVASFFYIFAFVNDIMQASLNWGRSWNVVSGLLMDPFLGCLTGTVCLFIVLSNHIRANRAPSGYKAGYQPALLQQALPPPNRPQPEVPRSAFSAYTETYTQRYAC